MLALVMEHSDDWKTIADKMGFKSKRETILEFLRVTISDSNREDHQYLVMATSQEPKVPSLKDVSPYNQAD